MYIIGYINFSFNFDYDWEMSMLCFLVVVKDLVIFGVDVVCMEFVGYGSNKLLVFVINVWV